MDRRLVPVHVFGHGRRLTGGQPVGQAPGMTTTVRVLQRDDVRDALPMAACIDAVEAAFVEYSAGRAELPGVIHLDVPEARGEIHVKAGHIHGAMKAAFSSLYGYASDEEGVRHALVLGSDAQVDETDAMFMLGACAAFVSYLVSKGRAADIIKT